MCTCPVTSLTKYPRGCSPNRYCHLPSLLRSANSTTRHVPIIASTIFISVPRSSGARTGSVDVHFKRFAKTPRTRITAGWSEPVSVRKLQPPKSSASLGALRETRGGPALLRKRRRFSGIHGRPATQKVHEKAGHTSEAEEGP